MSDTGEKVTPLGKSRKLAEAMREVRSAAADRDDVVIEMREAERMRLELLATELAPVIEDVPDNVDLFDFAISSGLQPRFWIDATTHVAMGRDKRTFRFLKDTRLGRVVLGESSDMKIVADQVTKYVAERLIERQRMMEGDTTSVRSGSAREFVNTSEALSTRDAAAKAQSALNEAETIATDPASTPESSTREFLNGLGLVLFGAATGIIIAVSYYWDRLDLSRLGLDRFGF